MAGRENQRPPGRAARHRGGRGRRALRARSRLHQLRSSVSDCRPRTPSRQAVEDLGRWSDLRLGVADPARADAVGGLTEPWRRSVALPLERRTGIVHGEIRPHAATLRARPWRTSCRSPPRQGTTPFTDSFERGRKIGELRPRVGGLHGGLLGQCRSAWTARRQRSDPGDGVRRRHRPANRRAGGVADQRAPSTPPQSGVPFSRASGPSRSLILHRWSWLRSGCGSLTSRSAARRRPAGPGLFGCSSTSTLSLRTCATGTEEVRRTRAYRRRASAAAPGAGRREPAG